MCDIYIYIIFCNPPYVDASSYYINYNFFGGLITSTSLPPQFAALAPPSFHRHGALARGKLLPLHEIGWRGGGESPLVSPLLSPRKITALNYYILVVTGILGRREGTTPKSKDIG